MVAVGRLTLFSAVLALSSAVAFAQISAASHSVAIRVDAAGTSRRITVRMTGTPPAGTSLGVEATRVDRLLLSAGARATVTVSFTITPMVRPPSASGSTRFFTMCDLGENHVGVLAPDKPLIVNRQNVYWLLGHI